ncbi:hypothetical protein LGH70_10565, partial [Hymenobacter sp. BT635]
MLRKPLLRFLFAATAIMGATSAAQAQQEQQTYANGSLNSLGIGSAYSTNLWSSSYVGFNLSKQ